MRAIQKEERFNNRGGGVPRWNSPCATWPNAKTFVFANPGLSALCQFGAAPPSTGRVLANGVVLVQGPTILNAGANLPIPPGTDVLDLGNALVLPGLIDAHTHLLPRPRPT